MGPCTLPRHAPDFSRQTFLNAVPGTDYEYAWWKAPCRGCGVTLHYKSD
jgi:hypothetical protein